MADQREVRVAYDSASDVLYVSFAQGVPAVAHEVEEGVIARLEPDTREVVGLTVVGLMKKAAREPGVGLDRVEGSFHLETDLAPA